MSTENKEKKERKDGEGVYEEGEENEKKKRREKGSLIIDLCQQGLRAIKLGPIITLPSNTQK